jgi:hypothetical protein
MQKGINDERVTQSAECLLPGQMKEWAKVIRLDGYDESMAAYKRQGRSP